MATYKVYHRRGGNYIVYCVGHTWFWFDILTEETSYTALDWPNRMETLTFIGEFEHDEVYTGEDDG